MKNFHVIVLLPVVMGILAESGESAEYSGGAGTEAEPYQIGSVADWTTLTVTEADWDKHFILIQDIDFADATITPIGGFTGVFDGDGHIVRNGNIGLPTNDYAGLFTYLSGGEIRNLGVKSIAVTGRNFVGGLVGGNYGTLKSCYFFGSVTANADSYYTGGLAGDNKGTMISCHTEGTVVGGHCTGGLVGISDGSITACYVRSAVTGGTNSNMIGGLVGLNKGTVSLCHASGPVTGGADAIQIGGLAGSNQGTISSSYATGMVTGKQAVGGLVGINDSGPIESCYARGAVAGTLSVAGLVAEINEGSITFCYSTGLVTGDSWTGGLVAYNPGDSVSLSYWNVNTSGLSESAGGSGRTTNDMTYPYDWKTYVGWDFTELWASDTDYNFNDGYPYLIDNVHLFSHPADANEDSRVVLSEAITYLAGWQQGDNPMSYAIRSAYLWQNGEQYVYDAEQEYPLRWALAH